MFNRSLLAELARHPELLPLRPKHVNNDPPAILYRQRWKGYYAAPALCRVYVLRTLKAARARGEWFVHVKAIGHDGTAVFAHFFTMFYAYLHEPGVSVIFNKKGALHSTSVFFNKLRRYIWAHR